MHVTHPSKYFDSVDPAQRCQSQRSEEVEDPQPVRLERHGTAVQRTRQSEMQSRGRAPSVVLTSRYG